MPENFVWKNVWWSWVEGRPFALSKINFLLNFSGSVICFDNQLVSACQQKCKCKL
jgi:hypothetical protein